VWRDDWQEKIASLIDIMLRLLSQQVQCTSRKVTLPRAAPFSSRPTYTPRKYELTTSKENHLVTREDMPYLHHIPNKPKPKFASPRKRASKLFNNLQSEAIQTSAESKPDVFGAKFRVGDAIELQVAFEGGPKSTRFDKIRGVVIAKENKGLSASVNILDVLNGEPVERKIQLHSPLVKSLKLLEKNFIFKGKRKVKRAKLYYLRDRPTTGKLSTCSFRTAFILLDLL